jgi:hypothetical protein
MRGRGTHRQFDRELLDTRNVLSGEPSKQSFGGAATDVHHRHVYRRERRRNFGGEVDVVKSGDRKCMGHGNAMRGGLEQYAQGKNVIPAHDCGRSRPGLE